MISLSEYLKDPCGMLSIPYWKSKRISIPDNMKIIHGNDFNKTYLEKYTDEEYFRLYHTLEKIDHIHLENFKIITGGLNHIDTFVSIINESYSGIKVDDSQIRGYTKTPVYYADLWILVKEESTGKFIGSGIADYDTEAHELILEWIQVLPGYRGYRIGQAIVSEMLQRMQDIAAFATVSGKIENKTNPEALYRRCGFVGNDVWHILREK